MATETRVLHFTTPMTKSQLSDLRVGDEVWLSGTIWGVRDASLIRLFDEKIVPDRDFAGHFFLHTAPSIKTDEAGRTVPVSVGTTTSMRMDRFTQGCINQLGGAGIIGKGGLSNNSSAILVKETAVYLSITGGAASLQTLQIEEIEEIIWEDLMPECIWKFRVKNLGPLFVTMDSHGQSQYKDVMDAASSNLKNYLSTLGN